MHQRSFLKNKNQAHEDDPPTRTENPPGLLSAKLILGTHSMRGGLFCLIKPNASFLLSELLSLAELIHVHMMKEEGGGGYE